jgi:hypothetical protein
MWRTHSSVTQCQGLKRFSEFFVEFGTGHLLVQKLSIGSEFCEIRATDNNSL